MSRASLVNANARAGFEALRAELHARQADQDLAEAWASMATRERAIVLRAAGITANRAVESVERLDREERAAVRDAIHRMSDFASGLLDRCRHRSVRPELELAARAQEALDAGDTCAARHFVSLITTSLESAK